MDKKIISLRTPHLILAGLGALEMLGQEAKAIGAKKVLVVTDKGVIESGIGKKVKELLERERTGVEVFDQVVSDPDIACLEACLEMAKKDKYDLIVGVGGGSSMDIASMTSIMITNSGMVYDYFGVNLVKNPGVPTILIPTTAGTGAEVTPIAILTNLFAKEAMILIGQSLRTAVTNGNNLEARYDMSIGSLYAGISFANAGVTAVHALAYPLGGQFNVAHGIANGLLLPYVMEFNALGNIPKFAQIAQFLNEKVESMTLLDQAYQASKAVKAIYRDLKIPQSLTELKIPKEAIPEMAKAAIQITRLMANNPRTMAVQDIERIYENAL